MSKLIIALIIFAVCNAIIAPLALAQPAPGYFDESMYTEETFIRESNPSDWKWELIRLDENTLIQERLNSDPRAMDAYMKNFGCEGCVLSKEAGNVIFSGVAISSNGDKVSLKEYPAGCKFIASDKGIIVIPPKNAKEIRIPANDLVTFDTNGHETRLISGDDNLKITGKLKIQDGNIFVASGESATIDNIELKPVAGDMAIFFRRDEIPGRDDVMSDLLKNSATFYGGGIVAARSDGAEVIPRALFYGETKETLRLSEDSIAIITQPIDIGTNIYTVESRPDEKIKVVQQRVNYVLDEINRKLADGSMPQSLLDSMAELVPASGWENGQIKHIVVDGKYDSRTEAGVKAIQALYISLGQLDGNPPQGTDGKFGPYTNGVSNIELIKGKVDFVKNKISYDDGKLTESPEIITDKTQAGLPWRITAAGEGGAIEKIIDGAGSIHHYLGHLVLSSSDLNTGLTIDQLIDPNRPLKMPQESEEAIIYEALVHHVQPTELFAIAFGESNGKHFTVKGGKKIITTSSKGAQGIFQLMPATFYEVAEQKGIYKPDPNNLRHNVAAGAYYYSQAKNEFLAIGYSESEAIKLALATYNWGTTTKIRINAALRREGYPVQVTGQINDDTKSAARQLLQSGKKLPTWEDHIMPYAPLETKKYVAKVTAIRNALEES